MDIETVKSQAKVGGYYEFTMRFPATDFMPEETKTIFGEVLDFEQMLGTKQWWVILPAYHGLLVDYIESIKSL